MNRFFILLFGMFGFVNVSFADLKDLGNGMIDDNVLNIVWMKDANLFKTLCDADHPVTAGFVPVDSIDAAAVCANNGAMTWDDAEAWVVRLNSQSYLGYNNWRQPVTPQPDLSCEQQEVIGDGVSPLQGFGYNCTGSELGHLFNASLANPNNEGTGVTGGTVGVSCYGIAPHCFQNTTPFINPQSNAYWSGNFFTPNPVFAWYFYTYNGFQNAYNKDELNLYVWPVRNKQSVIVPAITLLLF